MFDSSKYSILDFACDCIGGNVSEMLYLGSATVTVLLTSYFVCAFYDDSQWGLLLGKYG